MCCHSSLSVIQTKCMILITLISIIVQITQKTHVCLFYSVFQLKLIPGYTNWFRRGESQLVRRDRVQEKLSSGEWWGHRTSGRDGLENLRVRQEWYRNWDWDTDRRVMCVYKHSTIRSVILNRPLLFHTYSLKYLGPLMELYCSSLWDVQGYKVQVRL